MIRRARAAEHVAVARLHRRVRTLCLPYLPDLHTPDEDLAFFRERVFRDCAVWVADVGPIVGYGAFRDGWVDHLYIDPDHHRRGLGAALLAPAMTAQADLRLWVFQRNLPAIRFYEAMGFRLVETTGGSANEEREPDALYAWSR